MNKAFTLNVCLECRNHQENCCFSDSLRLPFTMKDIKTAESMGFKRDEFLIAGEYFPIRAKGEEKWWRDSMVVVNGKSFKINVKKTKDGKCIFLKDGVGCVLGKNRPAVCKIYPFWVNSKGKINWEPGEKEYCYMGKKGFLLKKAIETIKENPTTIKKYFNEIKKDCIVNKEKHKKISLDLVKKSNISYYSHSEFIEDLMDFCKDNKIKCKIKYGRKRK